jgi:hypothetical protein
MARPVVDLPQPLSPTRPRDAVHRPDGSVVELQPADPQERHGVAS